MNIELETSALPDILLSQADYDALDDLVGDLPGKGVAALLQHELDRARVASDLPAGVVGLGRWVRYADDRHPEDVRRVQLVLPADADIDAGRISILSHVGAGLIGLSEGESVEWPDPSGGRRRLTVIAVEAQ